MHPVCTASITKFNEPVVDQVCFPGYCSSKQFCVANGQLFPGRDMLGGPDDQLVVEAVHDPAVRTAGV